MSRRKKLSREERKLQAYLKQIEKMEKKQKKGKDPKVAPRSVFKRHLPLNFSPALRFAYQLN